MSEEEQKLAEERTRLREAFVQDALKSGSLLWNLERPANEVHKVPMTIEVPVSITDPVTNEVKQTMVSKHYVFEFTRWTHAMVNNFKRLPYAGKMAMKAALTPEEEAHFLNFKGRMVLAAAVDPGKWELLVGESAEFVELAYQAVGTVSGFGKDFATGLEDFMLSEAGFTYGLVWFTILRKTPSEVAALPETDVRAVNSWILKYAERMKKK